MHNVLQTTKVAYSRVSATSVSFLTHQSERDALCNDPKNTRLANQLTSYNYEYLALRGHSAICGSLQHVNSFLITVIT